MQNKDERDGQELLSAWQEKNKIYRFEGSSGVRDLEKLCSALDENYSDLEDFLADNPGACEAVVNFIEESWTHEWRQGLRKEAGPADGQALELKEKIDALINRHSCQRTEPGIQCEVPGCNSHNGELDWEDLANEVSDGDPDLQDANGEVLQWVFDLCEEVIKEAGNEPEGGDQPCEGAYLRSK